MFADKNNHLIKHFLKKKRSGGTTRETPVAETPVAETPVAETPFAETPFAETPEDTNTSYPDTKYLYKNITSTKKTTGIKTNICAFYLQDTHFVKYIVHKEESRIVFPSFVFETNGMQSGGFLDEDNNSTSNLDILFQTNVIDFVKSFFLQSNHTNGSMELEGGDSKSKEQQQQEVETISSPQQQQQEVETISSPQQQQQQVPQQQEKENVDNISSLEQQEKENVDNISSLEQQEVEENVDNISSLEQPEVEENVDNISSLEQQEEENVDNISSLEQQVEENVDNISSLEQPEEENVDNISSLEQPEKENVEPPVPIYYDNLEYIGYILSNDEPYVFVNIGSQKPLNQEYTETILSELFYTFKVFDMDVDMTIRTLFDNNRWLLHDDEPYSGYICKLNEESQLVNDEDSTDIINVESIGNYYYFSFRPLDKNTQKRFAIFPNEYACILDDTQMAQYKSDKMLYAQDRTIYFKGETLRDKKVGHEFMCVKTPSQFTHY